MKIEILLIIHLIASVFGQCWKKSYSRGVGTPIDSCNNGLEKSGLLCYDKCEREGFDGYGPVCWERCREEFLDHGAICTRNTHIYGKGCCCTVFTPECCGNCQTGYHDDGCTCRRDVESYAKKSFGRGLGSVLGCSSDKEYDTGLCYNKCRKGYGGVGPVCYQACFGIFPTDCGGYCARDSIHCAQVALQMVVAGSSFVGAATGLGFTIADLTSTVSDLIGGSFNAFVNANRYSLTNLFNTCKEESELDAILNAINGAKLQQSSKYEPLLINGINVK